MSSRAWLFGFAAWAALAPASPVAGHAEAATPARTETGGPRTRDRVPSAATASSFEALASLVADPNGPHDIELLPQAYHGDLVIERAVAIRGVPGTILEGSGRETVVTVKADDVTIEDVVVRGSGRRHTAEDAGIKATGARVRVADVRVEDTLFGISLQACKRCVVERAHIVGLGTGQPDDTELRGDAIKLWEADDSIVRDTRVERSRDVVVWYTKRALLDGLVVTGGRYGAHFMYAHDGIVRRSRFERNVVGVFVMYSMRLHVEDSVLAGARGAAGIGLGFKDSDAVRVRGNWLVANTIGTYLDNTPRTTDAPVVFEGNAFALNDVGMRLNTSEKGLAFHGNDFRDNAVMIEVDGGSDALGVDMRGNHYADYEGYDLDHDGVGDVAYEVKALSSELTETHPALEFFHGTAAMGLVDAVARAVPVFASRKLLVDPAPLARAPSIAEPEGGSP